MRHILLAAVAILFAVCGSGGKHPKLPSQVPEQNVAEPAESHAPVVVETAVEMVNVNMASVSHAMDAYVFGEPDGPLKRPATKLGR
jgi:hypothetical protein